MEFLAILIALGLLQLWGSGGPVQQDGWFVSLRNWLDSQVSGPARQFGAVLLPALAVALVQGWVGGALYGGAELALLVLVLLYSLGRGDLGVALTDYLQRWGRGDFEAAFEQLQQESAGGESEADPRALHAHARGRLYYRSFERLFAVLFWFVCLGPAAALVYRLAVLDRPAQNTPPADGGSFALLHWLEWIPARLVGISYALVGDFDACTRAWRSTADELQADAALVLERSGNAALNLVDPEPEAETREALIARGSEQLLAIEQLQRRALMVWLAVIAVLAMVF